MVDEILTADRYIEFLTNQYGNYVIQKTLQVADEASKTRLLAQLKSEMGELKQSGEFGLKIYIRLIKSYP